MVYKVVASKAGLKRNKFEFSFPGEDVVYSVPKVEFLPPWLISAIGDDMNKVQVAKVVLDAFFDFDVLKKFEDAVRETVQDDAFVQTHKSYFVNMGYISSLTSNCIVMDNGTYIPVNRRRADEVETKYLVFISKEGSRR